MALGEVRGERGCPPEGRRRRPKAGKGAGRGAGEGAGGTRLSRRRLLKLAAYSVPAASVLSVAGAARVLAQSPPPGGFPRWVPLSPANNPPPRAEGAMGGPLLFGGAGSLLNDLWEWADYGTGQDWQVITPGGSPPGPRYGHAVACNWPQWLLLFGGRDGQRGFLGDTWILESDGVGGLAWRQVNTSISPPARADHAMAYAEYWDGSTLRSEVLLFGGEGQAGLLGDTWIFDVQSETWAKISSSSSPDARAGHSLSKFLGDPSLAFLFGGQGGGGLLGDTWAFDFFSRTWMDLALSGPLPRWNHAVGAGWAPPDLGWGPAMYLFGGEGQGGPLDDTWVLSQQWVGDQLVYSWLSLDLSPRPSARAGHVMSTEPVWMGPDWSGVLILFGGQDGSGAKLGDTWALDLGWIPS